MEGAPRTAARERPARNAGLVLAWLVYAVLVRRFWFVTDDAFISFRYARNWARGLGLRYNPGDHVPVEGFSNFLWVALSAVVERLGGDPVLVSPWVSAVAGALLLAAVHRALRTRFRFSDGAVALATAALAACTPFAVWATGGLETMSFALLLFLAFDRLVAAPWSGRPASPRSAWSLGVAGGALALATALSRPEGVCWVLVLFVLALAVRRARGEAGAVLARGLGAAALLFAVGFAAYTAWRLDHFGHLLASSATAKLAAGFRADRLARGAVYVAAQAVTTTSLLAVPVGVALAWRRGALARAAGLLALAFPAWAVAVSGDFMAFGRFLVPGLAFGAVAFAACIDAAGRVGGRAAGVAVGLGLAVLGALPGFQVHPVPRALRERLDFRVQLERYRSEYAYWVQQRKETLRWIDRGRALGSVFGPEDSFLLSAVGAVGYHSDMFVYDRLGLVTREVAEAPPPDDVADRMPGHDNPVDYRWFSERGIHPTLLKAVFQSAGDAAELEKKARTSQRNLRTLGLDERYCLDVLAVAGGDPGRYLFVWRLRPPGVGADAARARLLARVAGGRLETARLEGGGVSGSEDDE